MSPPVTAAIPMKLPTSMCSGAIRHSPPRRLGTPQIRSTFDSIPSMSAPSETRKRQRSWTCGSHAALPITVSPSREDGRHDRVLGRHDARLVEEDVLAAETARPHLVAAVQGDLDARARRRRACAGRACAGRSRRRPAAARVALPKRASSGPASRNEARIRRQSSSSSSDLCTDDVSTRTSFGARPLDLGADVVEQREHRRRRLGSAARSSAATGSLASTQAASTGRTPFLFPDARTLPPSGWPPSITNAWRCFWDGRVSVIGDAHAGQAGTVDGRWS